MKVQRQLHIFLFILMAATFLAAAGSKKGWFYSSQQGRERGEPAYVYLVRGDVLRPGVYFFPSLQTPSMLLNTAGGPIIKTDEIEWGQAPGDVPLYNGASISFTGDRSEACIAPMPLEQHRIFSIRLSLNMATREDLSAIPGIGPGLAEEICSARRQRGGFHSFEELLEVKGIGKKRLDVRATYLTL